MNWGSSSMLKRRRKRPTRVTRGSSFILNSGPAPSLAASSAARTRSAPSIIVRSLSIWKGTPCAPIRSER